MPRAVARACRACFGSARGAPKTAMTASPMNLSIMPPWARMMSQTLEK